VTAGERKRFDDLLDDAVEALPRHYRRLLDEVSVVVLDRPTAQMLKALERDGVIEPGMDPTELCGLHTGAGVVDRGVDDTGLLPDQIHLFREGVVETAGGWDQEHADENIYEEICVTLLHELGHHFGLGEDDLDELGYA
jgi:predicted Zn-dependent protease with MMP-like domain